MNRALIFLGWEELPKEDRPPRSMWLDDERLTEWFKAVEKRREEKYKDGGKKEIEDPVENSAAKSLIAGG